MNSFHGRSSRMLVVALSAAWLAMMACANAQPATSMHHHHMPCCPKDDAGTQGCSQCAGLAPAKKEAQSSEQVVKMLVAVAVPPSSMVTPRTAALRELTPGLRYRAAVFRLKDDLRI